MAADGPSISETGTAVDVVKGARGMVGDDMIDSGAMGVIGNDDDGCGTLICEESGW
jgi:hypothetical protein